MAIQNKGLRKITNNHFSDFCNTVSRLLNVRNINSNLIEASEDDAHKIYFYNDKRINMECIKPDDLTKSFLAYMRKQRNVKDIDQLQAVDALCIDRQNNFFMIEFKNRPLYKKAEDHEYDSEIRKDLRNKMFKTLWLILSIDSMAVSHLLGSDVIEFARQHITYVIVVSSAKNIKEYNRIRTCKTLGINYTPEIYKKYKDYYFKDVIMLTEKELPYFIDNFKI